MNACKIEQFNAIIHVTSIRIIVGNCLRSVANHLCLILVLKIFQSFKFQTFKFWCLPPETTFPAMDPSGDPGPQPLDILPLLSEKEEDKFDTPPPTLTIGMVLEKVGQILSKRKEISN